MASLATLKSVTSDCDGCPVAKRCVWGGLDSYSQRRLQALVRTRSLSSGEALFQSGDPASSLHMLKQGAVHILLPTAGENRLLDFAIPGDLVGWEGLATGWHETRVVAVRRALICAIDVGAAAGFGGLMLGLARHASRGMIRQRRRNDILTKGLADQRLALFLLHQWGWDQRGTVNSLTLEFPLQLGHLAELLAIKPETLSRSLSRFRSQALVEVEARKQLRILDLDRLMSIAGTQREPVRETGSS